MESMDDGIEPIKEFINSQKPDNALRDRVIARLKRENLIKHHIFMKSERLFWIVLVITGVVAGFFGGAQLYTSTSRTAADDSKFLLLLQEDENFSPGEASINILIKEYSDWANSLAATGNLVDAEKLADQNVPLGVVAEHSPNVTGYFVIRAGSLEDALNIAKSHPHLKYNGGIQVRQIENINR
jgi:hypothetical protein